MPAHKRKTKSTHKSHKAHTKTHKKAHKSEAEVLIGQMKDFMKEISKMVKKAVGASPKKRKHSVKHKK